MIGAAGVVSIFVGVLSSPDVEDLSSLAEELVSVVAGVLSLAAVVVAADPVSSPSALTSC